MTFTSITPTKPGFYAYKFAEDSPIYVAKLGFIGGLLCFEDNGHPLPTVLFSFWCPLVPAEEIQVRREVLEQCASSLARCVRGDNHNYGCSYDYYGQTPDSDFCSCDKSASKALTAAAAALKKLNQ